jgi:hypothetical protein
MIMVMSAHLDVVVVVAGVLAARRDLESGGQFGKGLEDPQSGVSRGGAQLGFLPGFQSEPCDDQKVGVSETSKVPGLELEFVGVHALGEPVFDGRALPSDLAGEGEDGKEAGEDPGWSCRCGCGCGCGSGLGGGGEGREQGDQRQEQGETHLGG